MLYKFLSPERISVLHDQKVRFSQPSQLNDPFESAVLFDAGQIVDVDAKIAELSKEVTPVTEEDHALMREAIQELRDYAAMMTSPKSMGRQMINYLNRAQGVLSLSRANDNLLMWAHYGASHRGYVIGLDDSHPWFREQNGLGKPTQPHNVIYTSRRSTIKAGAEDFYERLLCYKSVEWAYEEEVRIFRTFGSSQEQFNQNLPEQVHLFEIPKECIKEVFIGANVSPELREEILLGIRLSELNVDIYEAYINDDRYEINFRSIVDSSDYRQRK